MNMKPLHKKEVKKLALGMTLLAVIALTACSSANGTPEVEEVDLSAVNRQVEAFGRIAVSEEMSVSLDVAARVEAVLSNDGQQLAAGEPVMMLDMTETRHQLAELEAELAVALAEVSAAAAELGRETARLAQDLAFAEAQWSEAITDLEARQTLYNAGAISQEEMDRFQREAAARENLVQDLSLQMNQQTGAQQVNVRRERAAALEGKRQRMQERLNQPFLDDQFIVCPYDRGAVVNLELKPGDRIEPNQRALRFINLDTLVVEADVLEEFIRDVNIGATVTLIPAADRSRSYRGKVASIADAAFVVNNETVVPVIITLEDTDDFLRPNFNVDVFIEIP
jgi:HlyD family secretion protein